MKLTIPTLLVLLLLITGCEKDVTDETDITEYTWELTSVEKNGETIPPDSVHVLEFPNDSMFYLNLSVNTGGGYYNIPSPGNINMSLGAFTEICCDDTAADSALLVAIPAVTTYRLLDDVLLLQGEAGDVEFIKTD